jgi:hypothetical protein
LFEYILFYNCRNYDGACSLLARKSGLEKKEKWLQICFKSKCAQIRRGHLDTPTRIFIGKQLSNLAKHKKTVQQKKALIHPYRNREICKTSSETSGAQEFSWTVFFRTLAKIFSYNINNNTYKLTLFLILNFIDR